MAWKQVSMILSTSVRNPSANDCILRMRSPMQVIMLILIYLSKFLCISSSSLFIKTVALLKKLFSPILAKSPMHDKAHLNVEILLYCYKAAIILFQYFSDLSKNAWWKVVAIAPSKFNPYCYIPKCFIWWSTKQQSGSNSFCCGIAFLWAKMHVWRIDRTYSTRILESINCKFIL